MIPEKLICLFVFTLSLSSFAQINHPGLLLTSEEELWLQKNKEKIRYAPDPSWAPREFIDDKGEHKGIVADYIKLIEKRLGVQFQLIRYNSWVEVMDALENGEVDFSGSVHKSPKREQFLQITDPFLKSPIGIIVKDYNTESISEKEIGKMKLACPDSYGSLDYIRKTYPNAEIILCEDDFSALMKVTFGEAEGAVIDLMTANHLIDVHGLQNLHLIRTLDFNWEIGIGVVKNQPMLYAILEKALDSISEAEREKIYHNWVKLDGLKTHNFFEKHQKIIIVIFGIIFILLLIALSVSFLLKRMVNKRTIKLDLLMKDLARKEEQYRLLVENQTDFIVKMDLEGRFLFVSSSFCKFFGKPEAELLGKPFHFLLHEPDLVNTEKRFKAMFTAPYHSKVENRVFTEEGIRWLGWTGKGVLNEKGHVVEIIAIGRDITEKKRAEKELIRAKEQAEESDRLKTAFLANISHEIRTPMNAIMGFATLLPTETKKELVDQYSEIIRTNSELLVHIIDDIVLYSRLQAKGFIEENNEFLPGVLLNFLKRTYDTPEYQGKVQLRIENRTEETLKIKTDYEKLKQILMNLTGNAFKYTPSGTITIGAEQKNNMIIFFVKDTGIGIPQSEIVEIFERFFRGSNANKETIPGTGLGLSIVKELVDLLNGEVWVESEVDKGSTFYVALKS
jgi:PAS domain S-box-containing protein